jgi:hypothetical protein
MRNPDPSRSPYTLGRRPVHAVHKVHPASVDSGVCSPGVIPAGGGCLVPRHYPSRERLGYIVRGYAPLLKNLRFFLCPRG